MTEQTGRLVSLGRLTRMDVRLDHAVTLGESPDNDICLVGEGIASHHARIVPVNGRWQVEPVAPGSAVSQLNGLPLDGPTTLSHLDVVSMGQDVELVFLSQPGKPAAPPAPAASPAAPPPAPAPAPSPAAAPAEPPAAPVPAPAAKTRMPRVVGPAGTWTLKPGRNTIGRSPQSDICLNNRQISRDHAVIIVTANELTIEHRGGQNPTLVNGKAITTPRVLRAGDRLGFVDIEFELQLD